MNSRRSARGRLSCADEDTPWVVSQERLEHVAEELRALGERTDELLAVAAAAAAAGNPGNEGSAGGGGGGGVGGAGGCARLHALHSQWSALAGSGQGALLDAADAAARVAPSIQALSALSVSAHHRFFRRGGLARTSVLPDTERPDTDDTDSQLSFSNASSPSQDISDSREAESVGGGAGSGSSVTGGGTESDRDRSSCKISRQLVQDTLLNEGLRVVKEMVASQNKESESEPSLQGQSSCDSFQESKVQVIASKGGNIIAVANPALSMSPAITTDGTDNTLVPFLRNSTPLLLKQEIMSPVSSPAVPNTKLE